MTTPLPRIDDDVATWRAFAVAHVTDARTRRAVLSALNEMRDDDAIEVLAALVPHARGQGRLDVIERIAANSARRTPRGPLLYVLAGELLASSGATRASCLDALLAAPDDEREGAVLSVALAARVPGVREANERERASWDALAERISSDPLRGLEPGTVLHAFRRGGDGLGDAARAIDHALLLCTAGAPRATVTHVRTLAQYVIATRDAASPAAARLLAWLARASTDPASAPASVRDPGWFATAVDALARTAFSVASPEHALRHAAERLGGDPFDRALAQAIVARAIVDARAHGGTATALADTLDALLAALVAAPHRESNARELIATLLGREPNGAFLGAGRWLSDDLRARVIETALVHGDLGARDLALTDLERNGVLAALAPVLRDIAASDPDPIVRQHARQLARGERL